MRRTTFGTGLSGLVWEGGGRMPVVLVHGLASNALLWEGVADRLSEEGHPVVAVDLRGHGASWEVAGPFDFGTMAADLCQVIGRAFGRPVLVAGQSWGGNVALETGVRHPESVGGVVCVDGGFITPSAGFATWEEALEALTPPRFEGVTVEQLRERVAIRRPGWPERTADRVLGNFRTLADGTVTARLALEHHLTILRQLWDHRPLEAVRRLGVPLLVLAVGEDDPARRERVETFIGVAPDAELVWCEGDHDLHLQQPQMVAERILGFSQGRWRTAP